MRWGVSTSAGRDSEGRGLVYGDFDHLASVSLDPEVATVDSLVLSPEGNSARICITGRLAGQARVGVSAWDTTAFRYLGQYARYHVLEPPISLGIGAEQVGTGGRSIASVVAVHYGQSRHDTAGGPGVGPFVESLRSVGAEQSRTACSPRRLVDRANCVWPTCGQEVVADVDVYGIVEGRFNTDVMCVLTDRETVRCWGDRRRPSVGVRTGRPVASSVLGHWSRICRSAGRWRSSRWGPGTNARRMTAGDVRCWGRATGGLLGYGHLNDIGDNETPAGVGSVPIGVSEPVVDIGGGDDFVCAVFQSGRVRCWGSNHAGQLGMGHQRQINVGDDETPADMDSDVLLGGRAVQVAGGRYKACALLDTGKVRCWGLNAEDWDWKAKRVVGRSFGLGYGAFGTPSPLVMTNLRRKQATWHSPGPRRRSPWADTTCAPSWTMVRCGVGASGGLRQPRPRSGWGEHR